MLDSYSSNRSSSSVNNSIKINAVTGNILKNYQKSFFKRFKLDGTMATQLFDEELPHLSKFKTTYNSGGYGRRDFDTTTEEKRPVVIMQMMMCGEAEVLAEIMWQDDFDKLFQE